MTKKNKKNTYLHHTPIPMTPHPPAPRSFASSNRGECRSGTRGRCNQVLVEEEGKTTQRRRVRIHHALDEVRKLISHLLSGWPKTSSQTLYLPLKWSSQKSLKIMNSGSEIYWNKTCTCDRAGGKHGIVRTYLRTRARTPWSLPCSAFVILPQVYEPWWILRRPLLAGMRIGLFIQGYSN